MHGENPMSLRSIFCVAIMAALFVVVDYGRAQTTKPTAESKPTESPKVKELKALFEVYDKALKEKSETDLVAKAKPLADLYPEVEKPLQAEIVERHTKGLKVSKARDSKLAILEQMVRTGGKAFGTIAAETESELAKDDVKYLCGVLKALGQTKDEKQIPLFMKFLLYKDDEAVAQSVKSLANFKASKTETKKEIFEGIMKLYSPLESASSPSSGGAGKPANNRGSDTAIRRLGVLREPINATLTSLSGKGGLADANLWDRWYRKEGKKAAKW